MAVLAGRLAKRLREPEDGANIRPSNRDVILTTVPSVVTFAVCRSRTGRHPATPAGGASAVPAGGGSSPPLPGGSGAIRPAGTTTGPRGVPPPPPRTGR